MNTKFCNHCKTTKTVDLFFRNKREKDGLSCYCKSCNYLYHKVWRKNNKEKEYAYSRKWIGANKERVAELKNKWRRENPEKSKASLERSN